MGMNSKRMAIYLLIVMFVATDLIWTGEQVHACSCAEPLPVEEAFERATHVFSGEVVDVIDPRAKQRYRSTADPVEVVVKVDRVWKGEVTARMSVSTALSSVSCGYPFEKGESYLIYASDLWETDTNLCSRTAKWSDADEDLFALGEGADPLPLPAQPSVLTDIWKLSVGGGIVVLIVIVAAAVVWRRKSRS